MSDGSYTQEQLEQAMLNTEVKKDIEFIKTTVTNLQSDLKVYAAQFVPNALFVEYKQEIEGYKEEANAEHEKIDKRVRFLERYAWAAIGIIGFVEIALQILEHINFGVK